MADDSEAGRTVINALPNGHHQTFHEAEFRTAGRDIAHHGNIYNFKFYSLSTPNLPNPVHDTTSRSSTAPTTGTSEEPSGPDTSNEIHIASFEDVVRKLEQSPRPTWPEAYVRSLSVAQSGLACWRPEPHCPYGKIQPVVVVPGHFGTYSAPDSFRIISHYLEDQVSIRATLDPSQGRDYNPPVLAVGRRRARRQNETIVVGASTQMQRDGRDRPSFEFQCSPNSTEGAALVLTSPVESEDLDDPVALRHFILENAETLYGYVNSIRRLGEDESLYFVTGCDKSKSWAMAVYTEPMAPPHNVLRLQWKDPQYDWTDRGKADTRTSSDLENNTPGNEVNDQCLFLRGYKLSFSQRFRDRMSKVCVGSSSTLEHGPFDSKTPDTSTTIDSRTGSGSSSTHQRNRPGSMPPPFVFIQPVLSGPTTELNRKINVVSVSESKITPKVLSAIKASSSSVLGLAPGYTKTGKLYSLAICDGSSALIVDFDRGRKSLSKDKKKSDARDSSGLGSDCSSGAAAAESSNGRTLIEELLTQSPTLAAFDLGPLALALITDFDIAIANAIDVQSSFPIQGIDKSPYAVVEQALQNAQLDRVKPSAERIGNEFLNATYETFDVSCRKELVCRAWLARYLIDGCLDDQAREEVKKVNTKGMTPQLLDVIARVCSDLHRLSLGKSATTKHAVAGVRNEDGVTHVDAMTYKHVFRGKNKSGQGRVVVNERGRFVIHTNISAGRSGSGALQAAVGANTTIITTGHDGPTLAEAQCSEVILHVLQGKEGLFVNNPWIKNIWFLTEGTLVWPEEWSFESLPLASPNSVASPTRPSPPSQPTSPLSILPVSQLPQDTSVYQMPRLNSSQRKAVYLMLSTKDSHHLVIVKGPPGTGKTSVIAAYVIVAARQGYDGIWLIAQSNVAVKNIALKLLSVGFQDWKILVAKDFHHGWHEHLYTEDSRFDGHLLISDRFKFLHSHELKGTRVLLSTLSVLSNFKFTKQIPMKTLIVDEASQIEVGNYISTFTSFSSLRKVCFIGDNKQLPPHGQEEFEELQSIFEVPHLEKHIVFLDTQYRMPPEIGEIISEAIYDGKLKSYPQHPVTTETISCYFIDVPEGCEAKAGTSWKNVREQAVVLKLAWHLQDANMAYKIITPYEGQTASIERQMKQEDSGFAWEDKCFNVDAFQGNEEDYIIISLVRSRGLGFLDDLQRTNVMLTRCKKGMFIITSRKFMDGIGGESLVGELQDCLEDKWGEKVWLTEEQVNQGQISNS